MSNENVWISLVTQDRVLARTREASGPLAGLTFAVKDNIDVAGMPTTSGCPAFAYTPSKSATVVARLEEAGAVLIGKTNMDQFATGLVGTRSPYGACSSVFNADYISGGSSSGSAVAVASKLVSFSLGTDTAGSGRIPAAFNGIVGFKPTRGMVSTSGVVPACRTLDCVSIFARSCEEASTVAKVAYCYDGTDSFSRERSAGDEASPWLAGGFRFGCPSSEALEFFGDDAARDLFAQALLRMESLGGRKVLIDFQPFRAVAELLYSGPWVAERYAAIRSFIEGHGDDMNPVVRQIIEGAKRHSAVDAFAAIYRLAALRRETEQQWAGMDVMVLPTAGTIYKHSQIEADPIRLNTNLGYYTNFVNLLDLVAIAVPAGARSNGLPFGISLIGPAFSDSALLHLGSLFTRDVKLPEVRPGCVSIAVVGAHLTGQPLNRELTERGARLIKTCRTSLDYRLYALRDTKPPKPGLVKEAGFTGPGIELEIWAMPENHFGSFVAGVPPPLAIGNATLDDGSWVKCFVCEPGAVAGSREITDLGGWRAFLATLQP